MDELEISKIVGAGCAALLLFVGLNFTADALTSVSKPETRGYAVDVAEAHGGGEEEEAIPLAVLLASADVAKGERVFGKCASCHGYDEGGAHKTGPNLHGVLGRQIAGTDFGNYKGVGELDGVWDWEAMNAFLENPKAYAPGTSMSFAGLRKPEDRANIMAFLNEQSGAPLAMPTE